MTDTKLLPTFKAQAARAFDVRLVLAWLAASSLPTLLVASPFGAILSDVLDFSAYSEILAQRLNLDAIAALRDKYLQNSGSVQANVTLAWICVLLLAPLLTAMAARIYTAPKKMPWHKLFITSVLDYGRWFWLHLSAFLVYLFGFGLALVLGVSAELRIEEYVDANSFAHAQIVSWATALLVALMTHFFVEIARAELLLDPQLHFPPEAFLRALKRRRLLRRVTGYLIICAFGLALVVFLLMLRQRLSGAGWASMLSTAVLAQCSVIALAWMRTTRLFVLAALADQSTVRQPEQARA